MGGLKGKIFLLIYCSCCHLSVLCLFVYVVLVVGFYVVVHLVLMLLTCVVTAIVVLLKLMLLQPLMLLLLCLMLSQFMRLFTFSLGLSTLTLFSGWDLDGPLLLQQADGFKTIS